jgi:hypothetical protein
MAYLYEYGAKNQLQMTGSRGQERLNAIQQLEDFTVLAVLEE